MNLIMFLSVVDGGENIRVADYNDGHSLYDGKATCCPFIDANVIAVWTTGHKIVIEVS